MVCDTDIPPCKILDVEQNLHGKQFIDLLKSLELCTLCGRSKDNYTYISRLGCSVVDYCVVELEEFNKFSHFSITSMQEVIRELDYQDNRQVPDHSLLSWQINLDQVGESQPYFPTWMVNSFHNPNPQWLPITFKRSLKISCPRKIELKR